MCLATVFPATVRTAAASGRRVPPVFRRRAAERVGRQRSLHAQHHPPEPLLVAPDPAHARSPPARRTRSPRCESSLSLSLSLSLQIFILLTLLFLIFISLFQLISLFIIIFFFLNDYFIIYYDYILIIIIHIF